jgi:chemotaxis protein methyltransferase CheR
MIDALTTNHTSFFREPAHFDFLANSVLPELAGRERISIWSAACSSGEEPYSIAFCLLKHLPAPDGRKIRILATDISTRVLSNAQRGAYPAERFQSIPPAELRQFLLRGEDQWRGWFQVKKPVREMIEFRRVNLMESLADLGHFPVIFCRNVMIYFDKDTQQSLVQRLTDRLEPGGYLFIGHAESLNRISHGLEYIQPAVYRKTASTRSGGRLEIRP